ncbi:MAG TPA: IS5 family transposase [Gemmataceae bacterium]|nr:IS5 family transposase [Gemmataceae bacterium]
MTTPRKSYPSDGSDPEWEFLVPYLTLMREDAPPREYPLRDVCAALRYVVKTGGPWDFLPHDFPPGTAGSQQARRWIAAGIFEDLTHDLRMILRRVDEREAQPPAAIRDARPLPSTPESGGRAGSEGAKKKNGSKVHGAVDTLGPRWALKVTAANEQERAQVAALTAKLQEVTGGTVEIAFVDQGSSGEATADQAQANGIQLEVVKHTEAKKGFVLRPRRWVVERSFGWLGRFRRLARDDERRTETLAGWHGLAVLTLLLPRLGFNSA